MENSRNIESSGNEGNNLEHRISSDKVSHMLSVENQFAESSEGKTSRAEQQKVDTKKLENSGVLPKVELVPPGANESNLGAVNHIWNNPEKLAATVASAGVLHGGLADAAAEVAKGACEELTQHPERVALNFAVGAAVTAGIAVSAPWVGAAALVGGGAYAAYEVSKNAGTWIDQFSTVADASSHSQQEVQVARAGLRDFGAGAVDITAGLAGGAAAGAIVASAGAAVETTLTKGLTERAAASLAQKNGVELGKPLGRLSRDLWEYSEAPQWAQKNNLTDKFRSGGYDLEIHATPQGHLKIDQGNHRFLGAKTQGIADSEIPVLFEGQRINLAQAKEQLGLTADSGNSRIVESSLKGVLSNLSTDSALNKSLP